MKNIITVIKKVESEFEDIYRITAENGLILDVSEIIKPKIGTIIEYSVNTNSTENIDYKNYSEYCIMNGILYNIHNTGILVSFGGLLGNIPLEEKNNLSENIEFFYRLKNV